MAYNANTIKSALNKTHGASLGAGDGMTGTSEHLQMAIRADEEFTNE